MPLELRLQRVPEAFRTALTDEGPRPPSASLRHPSPRRTTAILVAIGIEPSSDRPAKGETFPGEGLLARKVLSRGALLADAEFVRLAYASILGRPADPEGAQYYVGKIGSGDISRVEFVRQLLWSGELRGSQPVPAGAPMGVRRGASALPR